MTRRAYHIHDADVCGTGWRRLIGSPNLQIIFHKRATKYRALLRKMTYKDKGSYESSPPCIIYDRHIIDDADVFDHVCVMMPRNEAHRIPHQSVS